jgi:YVTN family beta-propeller protein
MAPGVHTVSVGPSPVAISSDGRHVWVANQGDNTVTELLASDGSFLRTIAVGWSPSSIWSDGTHVWVANQNDNTVTELSASSGAVIQTISVGSHPSAITADGVHVWVANQGDNTVTELLSVDGSVVRTINLSWNSYSPNGVASNGQVVWLSMGSGCDAQEIDAATGVVLGTVFAGCGQTSVTIGSAYVFVANPWWAGVIARLDVSSGGLFPWIWTNNPSAVSADGFSLWSTQQGSNSFTSWPLNNFPEWTNGGFSAGSNPVAISSDGNAVWVVNTSDNSVTFMSEALQVAYSTNGADSGAAPLDNTLYKPGSSVTVPGSGDLSSTGRFFIGWNTNSDGTGSWYQPGDSLVLTQATTMYAQWSHFIFYDANGGTGAMPVDGNSYNDHLALRYLTGVRPSGYAGRFFTGWNTSPDGTGRGYNPGDTYEIYGDVTLYAQWSHYISYDANGASGTAPSDPNSYDRWWGIVVPGLGGLSSSVSHFIGWNTQPDGGGTQYQPGDSLTISSDVTLYAIWVINPLAIYVSGARTKVVFSYSNTPLVYVVPAGVTSMSLSILGAQGGRGGTDSAGPSPTGGYRGVISGVIHVVPGEVITVGTGAGGADGNGCWGGWDSPGDPNVATGGSNPLGGYAGGNGGSAGPAGCSGYGGGGGGATVVEFGSSLSSPNDIATLVAGGSGGAGGSGQFAPTRGRTPESSFSANLDASSQGQMGTSVYEICHLPGATSCDGGAAGGGGGGYVGGASGAEEFGAGSSNEWFGHGGSPGQNSTDGLSGLTASYQHYDGNGGNGQATLRFLNGLPGAPYGITNSFSGTSATVSWVPPVITGLTAISDYVVEYSSDAGATWNYVDTNSATTTAQIDGLDGTVNYTFQVAASNSIGQGPFSSLAIAPDAPTLNGVTSGDSYASLDFTPGTLGNNSENIYQYSLDGGATWLDATGSSSPLQISGLTNGTSYEIYLRAVSDAGPSSASVTSVSLTPYGYPLTVDPNSIYAVTNANYADVSWLAPNNNGSVITSYEVTAF